MTTVLAVLLALTALPLAAVGAAPIDVSIDFETDAGGLVSYYEIQDFALMDGKYTIGANTTARAVTGSADWTDYTVEVDLIPSDDRVNSGIMFRVNELGPKPFQSSGYFAGLDKGQIVLATWINEKYTLLFGKPINNFRAGKTYHLKVTVRGNHIQFFVDDMETPAIEFFDYEYARGRAGIRSHFANVAFDNLVIRAVE